MYQCSTPQSDYNPLFLEGVDSIFKFACSQPAFLDKQNIRCLYRKCKNIVCSPVSPSTFSQPPSLSFLFLSSIVMLWYPLFSSPTRIVPPRSYTVCWPPVLISSCFSSETQISLTLAFSISLIYLNFVWFSYYIQDGWILVNNSFLIVHDGSGNRPPDRFLK